MRTCLTRQQYDAAVRRQLATFLTVEGAARVATQQYPKDAATAVGELQCRGVDVAGLPADQAYDASRLDALAESLELTGHLTPEAAEARAAGMSLTAWREAMGEPEEREPETGFRVLNLKGLKLKIEGGQARG